MRAQPDGHLEREGFDPLRVGLVRVGNLGAVQGKLVGDAIRAVR